MEKDAAMVASHCHTCSLHQLLHIKTFEKPLATFFSPWRPHLPIVSVWICGLVSSVKARNHL